MKNIKLFLLLLLAVVGMRKMQAQVKVAATVGAAIPTLDNGVGIHLGLNPSVKMTNYFSLEGQVSYIRFEGTKFISGEELNTKSFNALAGGRLYILNKEKSFRPYINLMGGVNSLMEDTTEVDFGFTAGVYGEFNEKFLVGVAVESYAFFVGKIGYQF